MPDTPNLNMPEIEASQSQKHVTHNQALEILDAVVQLTVEDKDLSTPPASPVEGARYIVSSPATGAWAGWEDRIATFRNGSWQSFVPSEGWEAWVSDEALKYRFTSSAWVQASGSFITTNNVGFRYQQAQVIGLSLSGASVNSGLALPSRTIAISCGSRITTTITGPTTFGYGVATNPTLFGEDYPRAAGIIQRGPAYAHYASVGAENIVVTPTGTADPFTGGVVDLFLTYMTIETALP